jgi:hypothetical protein
MAIKSRITAQKTVIFESSPSQDVVGYRMYYCPEGEQLTEDSPFVDVGGRLTFEVPGEFNELKNLDGSYRVAMVAYDDEGNLSASGPEVIVPLDFLPPEAPGAIEVS